MSRVYFHSPSGTVEVQGAERHHAAALTRRLFLGILAYDGKGDPLLNLIPKDSFAATGNHVDLFLGGHDGCLIVEGKRVNAIDCAVNTAMVSGSLPVVFAARLHAQCEIHAFVEGQDRAWLSGIIEQGVDEKVLRIQPDDEKMDRGWNRVISFLRERDDEPVVTSFSVCSQFPSPCAGMSQDAHLDEEASERFYALSEAEQWEQGMAAIRAISGFLRWTPGDFQDIRFGAGFRWNAFSLRDYAERTFPRKDSMWDRASVK